MRRLSSLFQSYVKGTIKVLHLLFLEIASQLSSRGLVDPVPDPLLLRKPGSAGNRTRTSGFVGRNSDQSTTETVKNLPFRILKYSYTTSLTSPLETDPIDTFIIDLCVSYPAL
jgi:hypothetical protein